MKKDDNLARRKRERERERERSSESKESRQAGRQDACVSDARCGARAAETEREQVNS